MLNAFTAEAARPRPCASRRWAGMVVAAATAVTATALALPTPASARPAYAVTASIPVGSNLGPLAIDQGLHRAFVAGGNVGEKLFMIDTTTNTVIGAPSVVGRDAKEVAIDQGLHLAYITHPDYDGSGRSVSVTDTTSNTVIGSVSVGAAPYGVAIDQGLHRAYVTNSGMGFEGEAATTLRYR